MLKFLKQLDKICSGVSTDGYLKEYKPQKGDTVVNIGAYFGFFAKKMSRRVGPPGRVIAIEPDPINFKVLQKRTKRRKYQNIILVNKAIAEKPGRMQPESKFMFSTFRKARQGSVECVTLDSLLNSLGINYVDLMTMDVEGMELEVVDGARHTLANTSHLAIACYHRRRNKFTGEILDEVLNKKGFVTKVGHWLHPTLYGSKKSHLSISTKFNSAPRYIAN